MHGNTSGLSYVGGHMKTSKIEFLQSNLEGKKKKDFIMKEVERGEKRAIQDSGL